MAGSVNRVILAGRLGKDPVCRTMGNGSQVVSFSLATDESWKSKETGERVTKTTWHDIIVFNEHLGKTAQNYLKKGSLVYVEGSIQHRTYEKDGQTVKVSEIVLQRYRGELTMLGGRADNQGGAGNSYDQSIGTNQGGGFGGGLDDNDPIF